MKTIEKIGVALIYLVFAYGVFSLFAAFASYVERFGL